MGTSVLVYTLPQTWKQDVDASSLSEWWRNPPPRVGRSAEVDIGHPDKSLAIVGSGT